jgi:hypothetical protein
LVLEAIKDDLKKERDDLLAQIEDVTVTDEQIRTIQELAEAIRPGLQYADFAAKRQLIDFLDVTARLAVENEEQVIYVECVIPGTRTRLSINSATTSSYQVSNLVKSYRSCISKVS